MAAKVEEQEIQTEGEQENEDVPEWVARAEEARFEDSDADEQRIVRHPYLEEIADAEAWLEGDAIPDWVLKDSGDAADARGAVEVVLGSPPPEDPELSELFGEDAEMVASSDPALSSSSEVEWKRPEFEPERTPALHASSLRFRGFAYTKSY